MELKNMINHNYGGFDLDVDKIGNTSISKDEIKLPYTGKLPAACDSATISFRVTPENINVILETQANNHKPIRYIVLASQEEVDSILWRFFFEPHGKRERTRFDSGLSEYWLGRYQAEFVAWRRICKTPQDIGKILRQFTREQRGNVYRMIERMEQEAAAAEG